MVAHCCREFFDPSLPAIKFPRSNELWKFCFLIVRLYGKNLKSKKKLHNVVDTLRYIYIYIFFCCHSTQKHWIFIGKSQTFPTRKTSKQLESETKHSDSGLCAENVKWCDDFLISWIQCDIRYTTQYSSRRLFVLCSETRQRKEEKNCLFIFFVGWWANRYGLAQ